MAGLMEIVRAHGFRDYSMRIDLNGDGVKGKKYLQSIILRLVNIFRLLRSQVSRLENDEYSCLYLREF